MRIDVPTLYFLTVATLCVAVVMTLWERKAQARRADVLGIWAVAHGVLAAGCIIMMNRAAFPGILGQTATNVVFVAGYLLLLHGVARLDGGGRPLLSLLATGLVGLVWLVAGPTYSDMLWNSGGAVPVALVHAGLAWQLLRSRAVRPLRARRLAVAIAAGHGLFYTARFTLVPALLPVFGHDILVLSAKVTMVEAVLYSVAMPTALLALVREEAQNQLLAAARTDYLTGLSNRHGFFEESERRLGAEAGEITLLAFDLDHFKTINDRHGHATGDEVLKLFARTARAVFGETAVLARIGGEEFAALLPGFGAGAARPLAESLCRLFSAEALRPGGLAIRASVSVGIAQRGTAAPDLARLLSAADRALYSAKSRGRDRVELAEPAIARAA